MNVARSEYRSLAITELVEAEQRVIADALEMAVVGCFFLIAVYPTLRAVNVKDDTLVDGVSYSTFYPFDI